MMSIFAKIKIDVSQKKKITSLQRTFVGTVLKPGVFKLWGALPLGATKDLEGECGVKQEVGKLM